jgi:hypothetical protein
MHEFDMQRRTLVEQFRAKHNAAVLAIPSSSQPSEAAAGVSVGVGSDTDQRSSMGQLSS